MGASVLTDSQSSPTGRRGFLRMLAALAAGIGVGKGFLPPGPAQGQVSQLGLPQPDELVEATIKRLFGNRAFQRGDDRIKVELPQIAEDGGGVAISVDSTLPVSGAAALSHFYIIADKNRRPMLAKFSFTPESGRAMIATSIRLATSTDVRVVAEMSDGGLYSVTKHVRVTISGCDLPPQS